MQSAGGADAVDRDRSQRPRPDPARSTALRRSGPAARTPARRALPQQHAGEEMTGAGPTFPRRAVRQSRTPNQLSRVAEPDKLLCRRASQARASASRPAGIAPSARLPQVLLRTTIYRFRHSRQQRLSSATQAPICTIWQRLTPDSHAFARPGLRSPSTSNSPSSPSSTRPAQWRQTASNPRPDIPPPCASKGRVPRI
jgi:hypothetical protein